MGKILLFNVNLIKANSIMGLCKKLFHDAMIIPRRDYSKPLGVLLGVPGLKNNNTYTGNEFKNEMMVFSGLSSEELDLFLDEYKKAGIGEIKRKAIITGANMLWTPIKLYSELDDHIK
ncbi:MAG: DUF3783 domain-containing protein [Wujia sp.]